MWDKIKKYVKDSVNIDPQKVTKDRLEKAGEADPKTKKPKTRQGAIGQALRNAGVR